MLRGVGGIKNLKLPWQGQGVWQVFNLSRRLVLTISLIFLSGMIYFLGIHFYVQRHATRAALSNPGKTIEATSLGIRKIFEQSDLALEKGQSDMATGILLEAIKQYPDNLDLLLKLGLTYRKVRNYEAADKIYRMAMINHPNCDTCLNNRAVVLIHLKNLPEATRLLNLVIAKNPSYADAFLNLGIAQDQGQQRDAALENYRKYLTMIPNNDNSIMPSRVRARVHELEKGN